MKNKNFGYSLIEILVVMTIFVVISIIATQTIAASLKSSNKSDSLNKVRNELSSAILLMERNLKNAQSILPASCVGAVALSIDYSDQSGVLASYVCNLDDGYIASVSAETIRLTSQNVVIETCSFTCSLGTEGQTDSVQINLSGYEKGKTPSEGSLVTLQSKIILRNY